MTRRWTFLALAASLVLANPAQAEQFLRISKYLTDTITFYVAPKSVAGKYEVDEVRELLDKTTFKLNKKFAMLEMKTDSGVYYISLSEVETDVSPAGPPIPCGEAKKIKKLDGSSGLGFCE